jgi:trimeric autotransporter adhesin
VTHIRPSAHASAVISCAAHAARAPQARKNQPPAQPSHWWSELRQLASLLLAIFLSFHSTLSSAQQTANYIYDELGRLKTVVAPNGDRAEYDYDAVGNLLAVRRIGTNTLTISEITPNVGTSGTVVTIRGAGFSATPASNTVKFNGVAATVTAATTTQLTVAAPAIGTTGTISVTVATVTATSQEVFTYVTGTTVGGPTITSFSPTSGPSTTQVTIIGTNFELAPGATKVELNGMNMPIVSLTATQIVVNVPADVASGKIRVITPKGIAVSAGYFYVPITGYADVDIVDRQSVTIGGAASTVNVSTANKYGLLLFDGALNDYVSLQLSAYTNSVNTSTSYLIYKPDNTLFVIGYVSSTSLTLHVPQLPVTGTYSIIFAPGAFTTSLTGKLVKNTSLTVGAATATAGTVNTAGQSVRYSFEVPLRGTVGIGLSGLVYTPASVALTTTMSLYRPDGKQIGSYINCYIQTQYNDCSLDLNNAPVGGTYSVVVTPPATVTTASFSILVSSPVGGALTIDSATPSAATIARVGQNGRYTFTATAGQNLGIGISDLVMTANATGTGLLYVYRPDGSVVSQDYCYASTTPGCSFNLNNALGGTYSLVVGLQGATGSYKAQVNSDVAGTLTANAAVNVNLKSGQNARYTFSGTAGQSVGIELAQLVSNPSGRALKIYVYQPTDTIAAYNGNPPGFAGYWQTTSVYGAGGTLSLPVLPVTGAYIVIVDTDYGESATFSLKLNAGTALTLDAAATNVTTTGTGQNPRFTFNVTAGQTLGIGLSSLVYTPASVTSTIMRLYKPDGTEISYAECYPQTQYNGCSLDLVNAPVAGTYSVVVAPSLTATAASFSILVSNPVGGALTIGSATPSAATIARVGQNGRYTFTATAGQNLGIGISDLVMTASPYGNGWLYVYQPDGTLLNQMFCYVSTGVGCSFNLTNVLAGTYSFVVGLQGSTGTYKAQVNSDVTGTLTANAAVNVNLKSGQNARYTFTGTAGQSVGIELAQLVTNPSAQSLMVYVYRSTDTIAAYNSSSPQFGGQWQSTSVSGAGGTLSLPALPATGTYTVIVDSTYGESATFSLKLNTGTPLTLNAAATSVTTTGAGQNPRFTFTVAAGQTVGIGLSGLVYTPASETGITTMRVYKPDGTQFGYDINCYIQTQYNGCSLDLNNAPVGGTYSVVVAPSATATAASFSILVSNPVGGALTIGSATPSAATIARVGQNGRYTFTATAGQNLGIGISDLVMTANPDGAGLWRVYQPDGTLLNQFYCYPNTTAGCSFNLTNVLAGTYSFVVGLQGSTGSYKAQVNSDVTGTLTANAAVNVSLKSGQNARYTFSGTAGQSVGIELAQLVTNPSARSLTVYVYRSTDTVTAYNNSSPQFGGEWQSTSVSGAGGTLSLPALPATGTYTVIVDTSYGESATFSLKARSP